MSDSATCLAALQKVEINLIFPATYNEIFSLQNQGYHTMQYVLQLARATSSPNSLIIVKAVIFSALTSAESGSLFCFSCMFSVPFFITSLVLFIAQPA